MKIKKLATICKEYKHVTIYEEERPDGEVKQFLSDGGAAYPIYGLPRLEKESLLTIFDIAPAEWDKWRVSIEELPEDMCFDDEPETGVDQPIEIFYEPVVINNSVLKPVKTSVGTIFYQDKYLDPVRDVEGGIQFYERFTSKGRPFIVIKSGLFLQAAIMEDQPGKPYARRMEAMLLGYAKRMGWEMEHILEEEDSEVEQMTLYGRKS